MASASSDNRDDTVCDYCGAPASWADASPSNLSWTQSLNHHLHTYLTSPRMWPIGYIISSPYSPFRLEMEMPAHNSWRDAFEDLLALESGGQMISLESRKKGAEVAKRIWQDSISHNVSFINDRLKSNAKYMSLLKRIQDFAARKNMAETLKDIAEAIPAQEESSNQIIATGKDMIAKLEKQMGKSWPASKYKMRGEWMASLVSSGALRGWRAQVFDSSEGFQVGLSKIDGDPDDPDGQRMTETELRTHFKEGIPMELGGPSWSTDAGRYPEPEIEVKKGTSTGRVMFQDLPIRPSILSQITTAECTKSEKGNTSTKVTLTKIFTDGTTEQKEIVDDSNKVIEENARVYASMQARNAEVTVAIQEAQYDMMSGQLQELEEIYELD